MESLKITVKEEIKVVDSLPKAIRILREIVRNWFEKEEDKPLDIRIEREKGRGPPALSVKVSDGIATRESLGP